MAAIYLEDLVEKTGISERNIKYWCGKYELPIAKEGRRNVYPEKTVALLELIDLLSESELFTRHFIKLQVQRILGKEPKKIESYKEYRMVREEGPKLFKRAAGASRELLPALDAVKPATVKKKKSISPARSSRSEIDEAIL